MTILAQSVHTHTSITHTPPGSTAPDIDNRASEANPESLPETFFRALESAPNPAPRASRQEVWDSYQSGHFAETGGVASAARIAANILGLHTTATGYAWMDDTELARLMRLSGVRLIDMVMLRWLISKMEDAGLVETKRRCGGKEAVSVRFAERASCPKCGGRHDNACCAFPAVYHEATGDWIDAAPAPKNETTQSPLRLVTLTPSGKTHARRAGKRRVSVRTPSGSGQNPPTLTLRPACPHCVVIGDDLGAGCSRCAGTGAVTITGTVQGILTALVQGHLDREYEDSEGDPSTVSNVQRMIDVADALPIERAAAQADARDRADARLALWEAERKEVVPMPQTDDRDDPFSDWDEAVDANIVSFGQKGDSRCLLAQRQNPLTFRPCPSRLRAKTSCRR